MRRSARINESLVRLSAQVDRRREYTGGRLVALIAIIVVSGLAGLLIAILPPGLLIRAAAALMALGLLVVCWMLRSPNAGRPGVGVLAVLMTTVALSVLWPRYIFFSIGGPHVNPQTLSVFASLAIVVCWLIYSPAFSQRFAILFSRANLVGLLALLWFAWRLLASLLGDYPLISTLEYVRDFVYLSSFLFIGCAIATYENGVKVLLRVLMLVGLIAAGIGLVEAFIQKNYFVQFASGGDSQQVADAIRTIAFDKTRDGSYRAQSTFDHPIVFAQFIAALIPVAIYCVLYEREWIWRTMAIFLIPIGILAILKSGSRAGVVSLIAAMAFAGGVFWMRALASGSAARVVAIIGLPAVLLAAGLGYFFAQELVQGRSSVEASSSSVRLKMLSTGIQALYESPIWGFGHGMAVAKAGVISGYTGVATIDSYLLTTALDSGYFGLILFLLIVGVFTAKGIAASISMKGANGIRVGLLVAGVLAIIVTFIGLSISSNMTLLWLLIAAGLPGASRPRSLVRRAP